MKDKIQLCLLTYSFLVFGFLFSVWSELQIRILNDCKVIKLKNTVMVYYKLYDRELYKYCYKVKR